MRYADLRGPHGTYINTTVHFEDPNEDIEMVLDVAAAVEVGILRFPDDIEASQIGVESETHGLKADELHS